MRAAEADLRALADGEAGTLRVGTFQSVGVRLLPSAMRRYVERWPDVEVRLVEAGYDEELHGLLERGELDLAFVIENDDPAFERVRVHLRSLRPPRPRRRRSWRGASGRSGPREIARLPLIAYRNAAEGVEPFLRSRGLEPEIVFRSDEGGIVQGLVGAGIGYAVVPLLGVDESPDVAVLEVAGDSATPDHDRLARRPHARPPRPGRSSRSSPSSGPRSRRATLRACRAEPRHARGRRR